MNDNDERSWLRHSLFPSVRLLLIYSLGFGLYFWLLVGPENRLIPDALWSAVVPESVTAAILGRQAGGYWRIAIPGVAEIDFESDGHYTAFVEVDSSADEPNWLHEEAIDPNLVLNLSGDQYWGYYFKRPGLKVRYETLSQTATPYSDFRVSAGTYRVGVQEPPGFDTDSSAQLVIGRKLTDVAGVVATRVIQLTALVLLARLLIARATSWMRASDARKDRQRQRAEKARFWREFMREKLPDRYGNQDADE